MYTIILFTLFTVFTPTTRSMIYKKRFIRNLVIFGEFHCSNSDVTRFLYVVKWETSPFLAVFLINHTACITKKIITK